MNKKLKILTLITSLLCVVNVFAQSETAAPETVPDFENKVNQGFTSFYKKGIAEKIYIQTDKPYYCGGEDIWFKGFIVNAINHAPITESNYIYVELTDQRDSILFRIKVRLDEYGFYNKIELPNTVSPGDYTMTAYTQWMRNWPSEFFFHKKVTIINPIDDRINVDVRYKTDEKDKITASLKLTDSNMDPLVDSHLRVNYCINGDMKRFNTKSSASGNLELELPSKDVSYIEILSPSNADAKFERRIFVPSFEDKIDVQFFPEGGALLAGIPQSVVFKAIGVDGKSRQVKGKIYNNQDEEVASIKSEFKGMGQTTMIADPEQTYYAEVQNLEDTTISVRVNLPKVQRSGCAIKAVQRRSATTGDKLIYQILATPDIDPSKVGLVVHSRGLLIGSQVVPAFNAANTIPLKDIPEGILTLSLVDLKDFTPIAERLVFVGKGESQTQITANKDKYYKREKVNLTINAKNNAGLPISGTFALSVTDNSSVDISLAEDNIKSNLLLTSDLKGRIEDPAEYFQGNQTANSRNLDLLMTTQGWRRFTLGDVIRDSIADYKYKIEHTQKFIGNVKGFWGNAARKPSLVVMDTHTHNINILELKDQNKFTLQYTDYPDSTAIIVQALGRMGSHISLNLSVEPEVFPEPKYVYSKSLINTSQLNIPDSYFNQSKERYYMEGGMRVIEMEAISVVAQEEEQAKAMMYGIVPNKTMDKTMIERMSNLTVLSAISTMGGVVVNGEKVSIHNGGDPLVFLDEAPIYPEELGSIHMYDVESIGIVTGPEAGVFGFGASEGVILINLKVGAEYKSRKSLSILTIKHLGYKKPEEFYQPKYDIIEQRNSTKSDLRTTIHWDPTIVTDTTGVANISFYTADKVTTYDIVLEGVSAEGEVIRCHKTIERQD